MEGCANGWVEDNDSALGRKDIFLSDFKERHADTFLTIVDKAMKNEAFAKKEEDEEEEEVDIFYECRVVKS